MPEHECEVTHGDLIDLRRELEDRMDDLRRDIELLQEQLP